MKKYNTNLFGQKLNVSQAIDSNAEGKGTITKNIGENANGTFNVSNTGSEDSKKTIHSIGIGTKDSDRSNALEIMQNGDIYLYGVGGYEGDNVSDSKSVQSVIQDSQSGGDYTLPIASADTLGGIKVGEGLNIDGEGVLSSTGSGVGKVDSQQDFEGQLIYGEIFNCYQGEIKNVASGIASHAEGFGNKALGMGSHVEGNLSIANGIAAHAEGGETIANNNGEHAEGVYNKSNSGETPADKTQHSIGIGTSDNGRKNAVEVMQNGDVYINGVGSYDGTNYADAQTLQEVINSQSGGGVGKVYKSVQGTGEIFNDYTDNKAIGNNSHAEGSRTTAEGTCSHTEGQYTSTRASYAHAEGFQTIANNMYEHAQGKHNISNTGSSDSDKTIHSIGIGEMASSSCNAVEVMTNGDQYIYGIGSYDGTNYSSAQTLQEVISNIQNTIWIGTQTQYDQLESKNENTLYFITE